MINVSRNLPWLFIAGVAVLFNACDRENSASTAPDSIPDRSLSASEYISLGMPSYDREWVGQDMAVAASKLQALAAQSQEHLPRFGSSRSGPVFARIVARDNLNFFRSRSLPLATRFPQAIEYVESLNAILKMYITARVANQVTGDELIELMGAGLRVAQVEFELVDEFVPTLSKDDPKYPVRMAGLDKIRQSLAGMLSGIVTTLTEAQYYDVGSRAKLLTYCRATFPSIVPRLTAPSRQEILRRLAELVDDSSVRDLRPEIISLRDEVRDATKAAG